MQSKLLNQLFARLNYLVKLFPINCQNSFIRHFISGNSIKNKTNVTSQKIILFLFRGLNILLCVAANKKVK